MRYAHSVLWAPCGRIGAVPRLRRMLFALAVAGVASTITPLVTAQARPHGPCDICAAAGTPCVTAHSTVRSLSSRYNGPLYQVKRADGRLLDIGALAGGVADAAAHNATDNVARIDRVPVFFGSLPVGHGGTFSAPDGGEWARVSARWLDWQLKGNADASRDFAGKDCRLCTDTRWTIVQKQLP